ncbi:hypothetical protein TELCIR_11124, partial [Teladorsagia circumcincta]
VDEARVELHRIINDREMKDAIILVFANKQDLADAMKPHEIQDKLGLTRIRDRNWYVQPTCAAAGKVTEIELITHICGVPTVQFEVENSTASGFQYTVIDDATSALISYCTLSIAGGVPESISTTIKRIDDLEEGKEIKMGGWEIQIQERIATQGSHTLPPDSFPSDQVLPTQPIPLQRTSFKRSLNSSPYSQPSEPQAALADGAVGSMPCVKRSDTSENSSRKKFKCPLTVTETHEVGDSKRRQGDSLRMQFSTLLMHHKLELELRSMIKVSRSVD